VIVLSIAISMTNTPSLQTQLRPHNKRSFVLQFALPAEFEVAPFTTTPFEVCGRKRRKSEVERTQEELPLGFFPLGPTIAFEQPSGSFDFSELYNTTTNIHRLCTEIRDILKQRSAAPSIVWQEHQDPDN
jgi:hypothetical protein